MPLPPGYAQVVRAHHRKTAAYLLATQPDCTRVRDEEIRRVRRRLEPLVLDDLAAGRFRPRGSWLLAVLLCRGDDTDALAAWATGVSVEDRDRVRFYYRRGTDLAVALRAWVDGGLGAPLAAEVRDFASFHKVFGKHLHDRVWLDHR
ncbi:MAG TPA: hypothetical protein VGR28_02715 [Candidatus Thermoplasmatota archaeon]|nr:hypothetical protein [Candidatus Thermoplasmatota archaeon]